MKKLINDVDAVVDEMLDGMESGVSTVYESVLAPFLQVMVRWMPPSRARWALSAVAAADEPTHAGFWGQGMLDAGVAGAVFTSPTG